MTTAQEWGIFSPKGMIERGFWSLAEAERARWTNHRNDPNCWCDEVWDSDVLVTNGNGQGA